ncbi:uncharacterized protein BYT42DRAFT_273512 [Radiomyces spectabilis]|uniref:uncharacterized protein n=1 Tax=Radiomyces spectabilis TaxID=64574 RepID=UPI00221FD1A9|nr:uncharacterized protein BYT42DRAFT_273512 [Radiomyces spectabilis]KAI8384762.1 hypothetical protein BYT42DRAFT_273512 [Radiomyces spectabilis]
MTFSSILSLLRRRSQIVYFASYLRSEFFDYFFLSVAKNVLLSKNLHTKGLCFLPKLVRYWFLLRWDWPLHHGDMYPTEFHTCSPCETRLITMNCQRIEKNTKPPAIYGCESQLICKGEPSNQYVSPDLTIFACYPCVSSNPSTHFSRLFLFFKNMHK